MNKQSIFILSILMLVGCKHPNGNGGNTATTTRVKKQEEPSFEEFVKNFCSDSCFQINHISFPLEVILRGDDIDEEEDSVSYIEKNKWKYFDLFNPSCEEKVCTSIDADNNNVVTIGYDCGIHIKYMFKRTNGTWTLYKIDDGSM